MDHTHYCTYCDYYAFNHFTGVPNGLPIFTGTYAEVVKHAYEHPIGDPQDMAGPISAIGDRLEAILKAAE